MDPFTASSCGNPRWKRKVHLPRDPSPIWVVNILIEIVPRGFPLNAIKLSNS